MRSMNNQKKEKRKKRRRRKRKIRIVKEMSTRKKSTLKARWRRQKTIVKESNPTIKTLSFGIKKNLNEPIYHTEFYVLYFMYTFSRRSSILRELL